VTLKERTDLEELVHAVVAQLEVALNDHAVGIATAQKWAGADIAGALGDVARAINNLADAVRDAGATKPSP
jgi:hypothetical protein